MTITLHIDPQGKLHCPYTDDLPLNTFGPLTITRASTIEWQDLTQQWQLTWIHAPWPPASFETREEALTHEHTLLTQYLPEYLTQQPLP